MTTASPAISTAKVNFDWFIIGAMFFLLPIDMINGILLKGGIELPISIGQIYKLFVLFLIFIRLSVRPKLDFILLIAVFIIFTIPSLVQYQINRLYTPRILIDDIIKTSKYISVFMALIYFQRIFTNTRLYTQRILKSWIVFSYLLFAVNILLKYLGLGFPMYDYDDTGTTGFFYAGNEISALYLVLYAIIGYHLYEIKKAKTYFILFFLFNLFLGITITSKTAMLGIVLVTGLILASPDNLKRISLKKLMIWIGSVLLLVPLTAYMAYKLLKDSLIMERIKYFYEKWDLVTFIFSERNLRVEEMIPIYKHTWSLWEKIMGGGQFFYENQLNSVIEIDFLDLFFAYGIVGGAIFILVIIGLFVKAFSQVRKKFAYARLSLLMLFVLVLESSIAGHVFNSGIAGIYIGTCLGLMFYRPVSSLSTSKNS